MLCGWRWSSPCLEDLMSCCPSDSSLIVTVQWRVPPWASPFPPDVGLCLCIHSEKHHLHLACLTPVHSVDRSFLRKAFPDSCYALKYDLQAWCIFPFFWAIFMWIGGHLWLNSAWHVPYLSEGKHDCSESKIGPSRDAVLNPSSWVAPVSQGLRRVLSKELKKLDQSSHQPSRTVSISAMAYSSLAPWEGNNEISFLCLSCVVMVLVITLHLNPWTIFFCGVREIQKAQGKCNVKDEFILVKKKEIHAEFFFYKVHLHELFVDCRVYFWSCNAGSSASCAS